MRVKLKYISGQTVRSISRSESLARRTVARVVQCEDVRGYVARLREQFYFLGDAALDAVRNALVEEKDARLGFEILKSIGVIPTSGQVIQPTNQEPMGDEDTRVKEIMVRLASIAIQRNKIFGTKLPSVETVEQEIQEELERRGHKQNE